MLFSMAVENPSRGSMPFHIIIEEAHRYVQKDTDTEILGYNNPEDKRGSQKTDLLQGCDA